MTHVEDSFVSLSSVSVSDFFSLRATRFPHLMSALTRIVPWSQQLACEVLAPGDFAVDLTAGKGRDTLALAKAVGPTGQVVAFDFQKAALQQTSSLLHENGFAVSNWSDDLAVPGNPGVYLVHACHSTCAKVVSAPVKAVMANLGYLPGGDQTLITKPETTLEALHCSTEFLAPGGRLAVTVYPSHPGGADEAREVDDFFSALPRNLWQVLLLRAANRDEAPYLLVAERSSSPISL